MKAGYNPDESSKYIMYWDLNNLYGWAMMKYLPFSGFRWVQNVNQIDFLAVPDDSPVGYILEVDIHYPESIHDDHKHIPFCPEHMAPPGSKQKKLMTTLLDKSCYVIHYVALKQAVKHGLIVTKTHRVLQFNQSDWLKTYIDLNTELRAKATNPLQKALYKLKNNSIYGKTMENQRKHKNIRLITQWSGRYGAEAYISRPNFKNYTIFDEEFAAVEVLRTSVTIEKPIYIGLCVLDICKTLLYRYHYEVIKPKFGDNAKPMYMDTDSIVYEISNVDVYKFMKDNLEEFDTSDYPVDNQYDIPRVNQKVPGLMKDEANGKIIAKFVGLRSKLYSILFDDESTIKKAKGVKSCVVKKTIEFEDYEKCLKEDSTVCREQLNIRSRKHQLYTEKCKKIALSARDDKRYLLKDSTDTLPWGHKDIYDLEMTQMDLDNFDEPPAKRAKL